MDHTDKASYGVEGFLKISDVNTGEVLVDKKNAIHFGNLTASVTEVLSGVDSSHIRFVAFGNGGTQVVGSSDEETAGDGTVIYKKPNAGKRKSLSDGMHNEIYSVELNYVDPNNNVSYLSSNSEYADIVMEAILDFDDLEIHQNNLDRASTYEEYGMIDEIAIFTGNSTQDDRYYNLGLSTSHKMVTHVIFHPIQKTKNRKIKIDYVIRVYMIPTRSRISIPVIPYKKPDPLQAQTDFLWSPFMTLVDTYDFSASTYNDNSTTKNIIPLVALWNENSSKLGLEFSRSYEYYNANGNGNGFVNIDIAGGAFGVMSNIAYYSGTTDAFNDITINGNDFYSLISSGNLVKYDIGINDVVVFPVSDAVKSQVSGANLFKILGDSTQLFAKYNSVYLYNEPEFSVHTLPNVPLAIMPVGIERDFISAFNITDNLEIENSGYIRLYTFADDNFSVVSELNMPSDFGMFSKTIISKFNDDTFLITTTGSQSSNMAIIGIRNNELKLLHYVGKGYVDSTNTNPSVVVAVPPKHIVITDSTTYTLNIYEVLKDL